VYDDEHVMDAEEAASLVELRPSSESIDNIVLPEAAALTHPELTLISICAIASESPAVLSSECIIHFVEPPRLLISLTLTTFPRPEETSFVTHMDATKEVSLGTTAAPTPDLDFSSHQFTTNSGGDGFSPARPGATATAIHADRLDLASVSFTTTDPAVQSIRMLLVSGPGENLSRLDVFEHGKRLLGCVVQEAPSEEQVQLYLDQIQKADFSKFSIAEKHEIASTVNRLVEAGELALYLRDEGDEGRIKRVTKMRCYVPNERSKGSIQAREGNTTLYTGRIWPQLIVKSSPRARQDEEKSK